MLTEEGSGKEAEEKPQKLILQPFPINLDPSATAQPKNSPLPVYILPAAQPMLKEPAPAAKAKDSPSLPMLQNFKKLWPLFKLLPLHQRHWQPLILHGTTDGSGAGSDMEHLDLSNSTSSTSSNNLQRVEKLVLGGGGGGGGGSLVSPTFFFHLFYFILFYFDFFNFYF